MGSSRSAEERLVQQKKRLVAGRARLFHWRLGAPFDCRIRLVVAHVFLQQKRGVRSLGYSGTRHPGRGPIVPSRPVSLGVQRAGAQSVLSRAGWALGCESVCCVCLRARV
jgi:hypothetical protein